MREALNCTVSAEHRHWTLEMHTLTQNIRILARKVQIVKDKKNHVKKTHRLTGKKAAPCLKWLVAGFPPRRPGSGQVGFVVDKVALGQVSPINLHSTKLFIIIITRGRYNRPFSGRRASGPSLDSTPPYAN
jgi:hypothetical protein